MVYTVSPTGIPSEKKKSSSCDLLIPNGRYIPLEATGELNICQWVQETLEPLIERSSAELNSKCLKYNSNYNLPYHRACL